MQNELNNLYAAREAALAAWDATKYNEIDSQIRKVAAYMRAENRLGKRDETILTFKVS